MKTSPLTQREPDSSQVDPRDAALQAVKTLLRPPVMTRKLLCAACLLLMVARIIRRFLDQLLTAQEVCSWLGISLSTVWRWKLPHVRVCGLVGSTGGTWRSS